MDQTNEQTRGRVPFAQEKNLFIQVPPSPTDSEAELWFAEPPTTCAVKVSDPTPAAQPQPWCFSHILAGVFGLMWDVLGFTKDLETSIHHIAHWLMLWSQGHYLGQASTEAIVPNEIVLVLLGIVFLALGIIASAFVVVTESKRLCAFVDIRYGKADAAAVRRWCMLLSGSCSLIFAVIQVINAIVFPSMIGPIALPAADESSSSSDFKSVGFFVVFRSTGILWGAVSGFLWFSLAQRELEQNKRWSAFENLTADESDGEQTSLTAIET